MINIQVLIKDNLFIVIIINNVEVVLVPHLTSRRFYK